MTRLDTIVEGAADAHVTESNVHTASYSGRPTRATPGAAVAQLVHHARTVMVCLGDRSRRVLGTGSLCLILAVLLPGCDQGGSTTELTRPTTAPAKVVSFSGTLQPLGSNSYTFTVTQSGYVEATLVGLAASSTTVVGLAIGTPSATSTCSVIYSVTTAAGPAAQIVGTGLVGTLCVTIFDVGNLTGPTLYTITVATS